MRKGLKMMPASSFPHSAFRIRHSECQRALTLVELLIVIVVIGILVSAILVGGSGMIARARDNNTMAVLQVVSEAVEQFKREQTAKPTISSAAQQRQGAPPGTMVKYLDRYDRYPPDELEVFTPNGLPGAINGRSLAPSGGAIVPPPPWDPMHYFNDPANARFVEHRDQLAMIVAIETMSDAASSILDRIPDKNRGNGALDDEGKPKVFLNRAGPAPCTDDGPDQCDLQIRPILDDWGNAISYMAQRDFGLPGYVPIGSSNHAGWNEASTELIRLNGGPPIIFSYGGNGKEQLTPAAMELTANASLVGDFEEEPPKPHGRIDNPLNDDNVYANPKLREKLAKGLLP